MYGFGTRSASLASSPASVNLWHVALGHASTQTVTLANISVLTKLLSKWYGNKKLWITEYGYQTSPPDRSFGVTWINQAKYLTEAYKLARKNPRITMMLLFLLRDEGRLGGWQSGLFTVGGKKKPAYDAFRRLPH